MSNQSISNETNSTTISTKANSTNATQDKTNSAEITSIFPGFIIPNTNNDTIKKSPPYFKSILINN